MTVLGERSEQALSALDQATERLAQTAGGMERSVDAAREAWEAYRERFDSVDASLERFVIALEEAAQKNIKRIHEYVTEMDAALAQAVQRLSGSLDVLEDLADSLAQRANPAARQSSSDGHGTRVDGAFE
ncbi:hypothetical protein D6833_06045 [Candidatus Parcubacteria bacterium]|nr:MAG: hypothetical protein D6833_06045 [Candidatus Parcubacteria bacterium]